jgi:hypothetical protein
MGGIARYPRSAVPRSDGALTQAFEKRNAEVSDDIPGVPFEEATVLKQEIKEGFNQNNSKSPKEKRDRLGRQVPKDKQPDHRSVLE